MDISFYKYPIYPWLGVDSFNSLPNKKILDWSKFKVFADNKIIMTQKFKFVKEVELRRVEILYLGTRGCITRGYSGIRCYYVPLS